MDTNQIADLSSTGSSNPAITNASYKNAYVRGNRKHAQTVSKFLSPFWSDEAYFHL